MGAAVGVTRGLFITLEGIEGSGKSTQAHLLAEKLREHGNVVVSLREPGSTPIGDRVRDVLLAREHDGMTPETEALLYAAARAQMVSERVVPAVEAGRTVVCDRYVDSTIAYQCFGRGLARDVVSQVNEWATRGVQPDMTVLLDLPVADGLARATRVACDRIEAETADFHERVRQGYLRLAAEEPGRIAVVDGRGPVEMVGESVADAVMQRLRKR